MMHLLKLLRDNQFQLNLDHSKVYLWVLQMKFQNKIKMKKLNYKNNKLSDLIINKLMMILFKMTIQFCKKINLKNNFLKIIHKKSKMKNHYYNLNKLKIFKKIFKKNKLLKKLSQKKNKKMINHWMIILSMK